MPLATARARFRFALLDGEIDRLVVRVKDLQQLSVGARLLSLLIDQRHAGVDDYRIVVPQQLYQQSQKTQRIFDIVMGTIAFVSLLVGGIGIMNIMLANVLERKKEIGLLRAIGARRRDIIDQFIRESTVICATGALLGLIVGAALAYGIAAFAGWQVAWAPLKILVSILICMAIGLGFSIYPARQAAALDPISAIREE